MKQRINLLLIILWMLFIFVMSAQTGVESGNTSDRIVQLIGAIGIDVESSLGETIHFLIRKAAHFFEYFILSLLCYNYLRAFMEGKKKYIWSIIISFLYACSDEFHQTFVPGRVGSFMDVFIDTLGASAAMLFVYLYHFMKNNLENGLEMTE